MHRSSRSSASVDQNHGASLPFLSLTLADRTGCSFLELWRNAALYVYEQAQNWHEDEEVVMIRVSFFSVLDDKQKSFPKSCHIRGMDNVVVERVSTSSSPFLVDSKVKLDSSLFAGPFTNLLSTTPPFEINITGIVAAIEEVSLSHRGAARRSFRLQDTEGSHVECRAFGRHTMSPFLLMGNELVIFGARKQGLASCLWVFNNCHIVQLNSNRF